jgi:hypothetical protein
MGISRPAWPPDSENIASFAGDCVHFEQVSVRTVVQEFCHLPSAFAITQRQLVARRDGPVIVSLPTTVQPEWNRIYITPMVER